VGAAGECTLAMTSELRVTFVQKWADFGLAQNP
jgi:hypothetical protein